MESSLVRKKFSLGQECTQSMSYEEVIEEHAAKTQKKKYY